MSKVTPRCYMCGEFATSVEHVPAKCFFPKGQRINLITVPSCSLHNNDTSKDDEYVRGIVVSSAGNNRVATHHWKNNVLKSYKHSLGLFLTTFEKRQNNAFFHDRARIDSVMIKIAYGLYFHIFKKVWHSSPAPFYNKFYNDDGETDRDFRLLGYSNIPYEIYDGGNQQVFKYQYFEGNFNGQPNVHFKLIFYDSFEVLIFPVDNGRVSPLLVLNLTSNNN